MGVTMYLTKPESRLAAMDAGICDALDDSALARFARAHYAAWRHDNYDFASAAPLLTAPQAQAKLRKSDAPTYGLTLRPASLASDIGTLCPWSTSGCRTACLDTAGKGNLAGVQLARDARTRYVLDHPRNAGMLLGLEIVAALKRHNGRVLLRLNVTSDIRWECVIPNAMARLSAMGVGFYDYTKASPNMRRNAPAFYSLTYSASERTSLATIAKYVSNGHNVAVPFNVTKATIKDACKRGDMWYGMALSDGVSSDDRTRDARGVIVALAALGNARHDTSGFVRDLAMT